MTHLLLPRRPLVLLAASASFYPAVLAEQAQPKCSERGPLPRVPSHPLEHNGISMPDYCFEGDDDEHVFLLGDYGGITCGHKSDATHWRDPNSWACHRRQKGVYAMSADNTKDHDDRGRRTVRPQDQYPQQMVAQSMRKLAPINKPRYVLNGGDNFYFGGLDTKCGHPMNDIHERTRVQFDIIFEKMYSGPGMDVPWFSTFGNHDFGGRIFTAAWDQQIAYTWAKGTSGRWILPGFYWHQHVKYPSKNFTVDYYMVDTNKGDAKPFTEDKNHNICGQFNEGGATCARIGGPKDKYSCHWWFDKLWNDQAKWLDQKLSESTADWQILVTHFPPDQFKWAYWKDLTTKYGLDLFVGSHRHMQEVHIDDRRFNRLNWVVVGGGGGISSEWNPDGSWRGLRQYGFMDLKLTKTELAITSINWNGRQLESHTITPRPAQGEHSCAHYGCGTKYQWWAGCQCSDDCWKHGNCCEDFHEACPELASCKVYGCNTFTWKRPCQCTRDCEAKNTCCSDWSEQCDSPELRAAEEACKAPCELKGQSFPCRDRTYYMMRQQHKSAEDALNATNEECVGQCNCTAEILGNPWKHSEGKRIWAPAKRKTRGDILDEDADSGYNAQKKDSDMTEDDMTEEEELDKAMDDTHPKAVLLRQRAQLIEELSTIEGRMDPAARDTTIDTQRVWSDLSDMQ